MPIFLGVYFEKGVTSETRALVHDALAPYQEDVLSGSTTTLCFALQASTSIDCALTLHQQLTSAGHKAAIALHVGKAQRFDGILMGPPLDHLRYIVESGWPGQILFSQVFVDMYPQPNEIKIKDLGWQRLEDLTPAEHIYQLIHPELPRDAFPPLRTLSTVSHNLPPQSRPFIGREKEREALSALLKSSEHRLITLKGPGGIGKTRLALQVAAENALHFSDGVYFVELASANTPERLLFNIVDTLDLYSGGRRDPKDQLLKYLRQKNILLILDTFEHLLAALPLVTELILVMTQSHLLITSREALQLTEETVYPVSGLACPPRHPNSRRSDGTTGTLSGTYDGIQLFVQAAQRVSPLFILSEKNSAAITEICHRLAGMPLGIELAASWTHFFSAREIADHLADDLDTLTINRRDIQQRHRSLRVVFEHSWRLLSPNEQDVLPCLTIFRGGFKEEAVQAIVGASPNILSSLQAKSLLSRSTDGRFGMLQPVRQFAAEELALRTEIRQHLRDRHAAYYLDLVAEHTPDLWKHRQQAVLHRLAFEIPNIRAAWLWATEQGQVGNVGKAIEFMYRFHQVRGHFEEGESLFRSIQKRLDTTLPKEDRTSPEIRANLTRLQEGIAMFAFHLSRFDEAREILEESRRTLQALNMQRDEAFVLLGLGMLAQQRGELGQAQAYHMRSHNLFRLAQDRAGVANALYQMGNVHYALGSYKQARRYYRKSIALRHELGDKLGVADCLYSSGRVDIIMGHLEKARDTLQQSQSIYRTLKEKQGLSSSQVELGFVALIQGHFEDAEHHFKDAYAVRRELGDPALIAESLIYLTNAHCLQGNADRMKTSVRKVLALRSDYEQPIIQGFTSTMLGTFYLLKGDVERAVRALQDAMNTMAVGGYPRERLITQFHLSRTLIMQGDLAQAETLCREILNHGRSSGAHIFTSYALNGLGMIALARGSYTEAQAFFGKVIEISLEIGTLPPALMAIENVAHHIIAEYDPERALAWLTLVLEHSATNVFERRRAQRAFERIVQSLPAERVEAARARGRALSLDEIVTELLAQP